MTTNVPAMTIGPNGPVLPDEEAILTGRQADLNTAFGGNLSSDVRTPQGQIASSDAAIVGDVYGAFADILASIDPATAAGRGQDAIGAIYDMERIPAASTVAIVTCSGLTNTPIPINAKAVDQAGNLYMCIEAGVIPSSGSVDLEFACAILGPISCPPGYVNKPYQAIPGWDSAVNAAAGVLGSDVESPAAFEYRRQQSVALNANGQTGAVGAAVFQVPGVLDVYSYENELSTMSGAAFTGAISGNQLSVSSVTGAVKVGQMVMGAGVVSGTVITGGTASPYTVSISQTVASESMTSAVGGVRLAPNSIYVAAFGGNANDIAAAILRKKNPGCNYNGNTTATVPDTNPVYGSSPPVYAVTFQVPTPTAVKFAVSMQNNANIPSSAPAQIRAAIIAAFNGQDGGSRARIASQIIAGRFYGGITGLGAWAQPYEIQLGIDAPNQFSVRMRMDQIPTIVASDIAVTFS